MKGSKLQKLIMDYLTAHKYPVINVVVASRNGESDLVACIEGRFCLIEVKGAGDTEKKLQQSKQAKVTAAKGYAIFAYSLDDVRQLITQVKASTQS